MVSVKSPFILLCILLQILSILMLSLQFPSEVYALNGFIDPNGDGSTGAWTTTGGGHFSTIDEATRQPTVPTVSDFVSNSANNGTSLFINMNSIVGATTVTAITVWIYHNDGNNGQIGVQLYDDNETTSRSGIQNVAQSSVNTWSQVSFNGLSLNQTELDSLTIQLQTSKNGGGQPSTINVYALYADVTYSNVTTSLEQSNYRLFNSINSTNVGAPYAAENSGAVLNASGDDFRLRLLFHVSGANLGVGARNFKLQFAGRGNGTCVAPSGTPANYTDVTGASLISYNNLTGGISDGDALTTNANDPSHSGDTTRAQTVEESNNFTNTQSVVAVGEDGLWDFALSDNNAPAATTYCFRVVESDGTLLDTYTNYPRITTGNGVLSIDIVDAIRTPVANPVFALNTTGYLFFCEATNTVLGNAAQRIEVSNFTATPAWNVTIAATTGATTTWTDGGVNSYDFNDPNGSPAGCIDGGDGDAVGGQLSIDPSLGVNTPDVGCTTTGVSFGSASSYSEGVNDSITIASASSSASTGCFWQLTDIPISQQIPQDQASGSYTINLTLTVTAI